MISAPVPSISPVAPAISSRRAHISQLPSSQFCTPTNLPPEPKIPKNAQTSSTKWTQPQFSGRLQQWSFLLVLFTVCRPPIDLTIQTQNLYWFEQGEVLQNPSKHIYVPQLPSFPPPPVYGKIVINSGISLLWLKSGKDKEIRKWCIFKCGFFEMWLLSELWSPPLIFLKCSRPLSFFWNVVAPSHFSEMWSPPLIFLKCGRPLSEDGSGGSVLQWTPSDPSLLVAATSNVKQHLSQIKTYQRPSVASFLMHVSRQALIRSSSLWC